MGAELNVEQAIGRDRIRKALSRYENKPGDSHAVGLVREVSSDGSYEVLLPGDVQETRCAAFCKAEVGDVVKVLLNSSGRCDALARLGGDLGKFDSLTVDGSEMVDHVVAQGTSGEWQYWKFASGLAVCHWEPADPPITKIATAAGSLYKSGYYDTSLPFTVYGGDAFGGFRGYAYDLRTYMRTDGSGVRIEAYNPTSVSSTSAVVRMTVVGRWK